MIFMEFFKASLLEDGTYIGLEKKIEEMFESNVSKSCFKYWNFEDFKKQNTKVGILILGIGWVVNENLLLDLINKKYPNEKINFYVLPITEILENQNFKELFDIIPNLSGYLEAGCTPILAWWNKNNLIEVYNSGKAIEFLEEKYSIKVLRRLAK